MRPSCAFALGLVALSALAQAPTEVKPADKPRFEFGIPNKPFTSEVANLMREISEHPQALGNLEELADNIGPRLTGSERLREAEAWAVAKLKGYGAVNTHLEDYDFGPSWTRGHDWGRLLNLNGMDLHLAAMAWSAPTKGVVRGEVALLQAKTLEELKAQLPGMEGRIVLMGALPRPDAKADRRAFRREVMELLKGLKAGALLRSSGRPGDLLNMGGGPQARPGSALVPTAFLSGEQADQLERLVKRGQHPLVELQIAGETSKQSATAHNVVAEIQGSQWPKEVVILGAHLDSWDLGTGATDNGTGVVAVMEVLRAMQALGLKPKRTLRVVLFSGEEQGLLGSKAYASAHAAEAADMQAVLVDDMGTGRILGWPDMGQESWRGPLAQAMAPANNLGCREIGAFLQPGDTDHWPFYQLGVPAFAAIQDPVDYMKTTHHSQADTFTHVIPADLVQGTQALAATAWGFLNMVDRVPHIAPAPKTERP
jgi:hypothetical protein